jgi:hypothetical protein
MTGSFETNSIVNGLCAALDTTSYLFFFGITGTPLKKI